MHVGNLAGIVRGMSIPENQILTALQRCWLAQTSVCYNPEIAPISYGQCAPTAIVVQETFGGEILKTAVGKQDGTSIRHFYNRIDGVRYDFTSDQFDGPKGYWLPLEYDDQSSSIADALTETLPGQADVMRAAFRREFDSDS